MVFRMLLLLMLCGSALSAQDLLSVEEVVLPELRRLNEGFAKHLAANEGEKAREARRAMRAYLVGKTVSGGYLTDRDGRVWNFGVLDQPYVLHTVSRPGNLHAAQLRELADAYANEVLTFLVYAPGKEVDPALTALLDQLGPNVVTIEEADPRTADGYSADNRLLGLLGYPITYYVGRDRRIRGVNAGLRKPTSKSARKDNQKMYRKAVRDLLGDRTIKW